jgi:hypothetical protein
VAIATQVSLTQGASIFAAATLQAVDSAGVFNTISNNLNQSSGATSTNPLDIFGSLFASLGSYAVYVYIFLAIIAAAFAYSKWGKNFGGDGDDGTSANDADNIGALSTPVTVG